MKFPLPADTFPPVTLSEDDEEALEAIAEIFVKKTVTQYLEHLTKHNSVVNQSRWKSVKHRDDLRVYRERRAYRRDANNQADHDDATDGMLAMLTFGTMPGNLDDVMYGALNPTTEDMMLKSAYVDDGFVDWAVLASIIQPTPESPFRELSIKWTVKGHPFLVGTVLRRGDTVYIESIGFAVSPNGERIGYYLRHSVDIPGIRELEEFNILRAKISFCHLFRQRDANTVEVYIRGLVAHAEGSPIRLVAATAAEVCISVWKNVHCAEMKKLTRIVQSSLAARLPSMTSASTMSYASSSSSSSASSSLESWSLSSSSTSSSLAASSANTCARCHERAGSRMASLMMASTPSTSTSRKEKHCRICHLRVCSRCRVYKVVFLRADREKVCSQANMLFCTQCAVTAAHVSSRSFAEDDALERESKQSNDTDQDESESGHSGRAFSGRTSMTSSVHRLPLFMQYIILSKDDAQALKNLSGVLIEEILQQYRDFIENQKETVDKTRWRKAARRENVTVYKERHDDSAKEDGEQSSLPLVMAVGSLNGELDDVMYGVINNTQELMCTKSSYLDDRMVDCNVLAAIIKPTKQDPMRSLTLKWHVKGRPIVMGPLVRFRDFVYLESTGIAITSTGQRIGYHIQHSVDVPGIRELHELSIVRANLSTCALYPERHPGDVELFVKSFVDPCGGVPSSVAVGCTSAAVLQSWKNIRCAQMKKLNWLLNNTSSTVRVRQREVCSVCERSFMWAFGVKKSCRICLGTVCSRCRVKKKLNFLSPFERGVMKKGMIFCTRCLYTANQTSALAIAIDEVHENSMGGLLYQDSDGGGSIWNSTQSISSAHSASSISLLENGSPSNDNRQLTPYCCNDHTTATVPAIMSAGFSTTPSAIMPTRTLPHSVA
uniref:FYVE-type domain-containing protein n=1 Tax=Globisporangium ultimum (strain ATCC 200006 / CBS 805.95 / DAOM BR144) TaxID=431595 RepID=K3W6A6_GLOUD